MDWYSHFSHWTTWAFIALCIVTAAQLFYSLYFFLRVARFKAPSQRSQSQTHPISVVVCARDEAHNLEKNLPAILTQSYHTTHEIVLVNDNSLDDTKFFTEELSKIFKNMTPINLTQEAVHIPGKKYPLSIGIKSSKHEIMLLTDADCAPASPLWIQKMQDAYHNGVEIVLGYGAYEKKPGMLNKLIRFETFLTAIQYMSYALAGLPYMGVGRNLSYRKELFYRVKGFSSINHIPGGDDDLFINKVATKHNTTVVLDQEAFTISSAPETFQQWCKQKNRHYTTAKFYKPVHKKLLGLYAATQFLFYPLLFVSAIFFDWRIALAMYGVKMLVQGLVWRKVMHRLNEKDLFPIYWLLDIWQFVYYIVFSVALVKKPKNKWK